VESAESRKPHGPSNAEFLVLKLENDRLRKRVQELERKISLQPQTGLPTHFRMEVELDDMIEDFQRRNDQSGFTLLIIQLGDNYHVIRRTAKSGVSEWILYQTACRLTALLRPQDKIFHTHESEFVVVLPGLKGSTLGDFLSKLYGKLNEPHIFSAFNVVIKTTIGAAYWPEHGQDRSVILHNTDIAVDAATEQRKPFALFKEDLLRRVLEKMELQNSIIRAIEKPLIERIGEQFVLYYQPKLLCSSIDGMTLHVDKVEAEVLIRWRHPEKGLIMPSTFIPLAEETGLIIPLGKWLIYQSVRRLATWQKEGRGDIAVSINLSAQQFHSDEAANVLKSAIESAGIDPDLVTIEITETCLFEEPNAATIILDRFKKIGVRLSVDDFGTGFSSLSHLHRFPINEIKIDRLFVENIDTNHSDKIIVESLVSIAHGLGLSLVAEGVENEKTRRILWSMGCRCFQGYLIAKALSAEDFIAFRDSIEERGFFEMSPEE
jgi:EAL domain-containing protein (putative c-di-GMP-specific phosphodiesterase class I)/GGDEF domain-containing protein